MEKKALKNKDIEIQYDKSEDDEISKSFCREVCCTLPLVCKSLKLKMLDHLLLGGEHDVKISPQCNSPQQIKDDPLISSDEKKEIVLQDPKFGMFSLFKYHLKYGYKNVEMKRTNRFYCSHVFSLTFALPILILIAQVMLYLSLVLSEARNFDGNICPNKSVFEHKLMICGISLIYFVRSFFICIAVFSAVDIVYNYNKWPININKSYVFPYIEKGSNYLIKEFPNEETYQDSKKKIEGI